MSGRDWIPPRLRVAGLTVRRGGVIAYPTEGVYGLGCRPDDALAVDRILELKGRPADAGLILIAAHLEQLAGFVDPSPREEAALAEPGVSTPTRPVTFVVRAGPLAAGWITGGRDTVAVRITAHPVAAALCRAAGLPLVSTSANRRGRPPARTAWAVRRRFPTGLDLVVGGAVGGARGPSELRVAATGRILRPG